MACERIRTVAKKAKFFEEKIGGELRFCGERQERLHGAWVDGLPDKAIVETEKHIRRPAKTTPQLGYYYGVIVPTAIESLLEAGYNTLFDVAVGDFKVGVATSEDSVDMLFKTLFRAHKNLDETPCKKHMTDEEMGQLIDFSMMWLVENLHVVVPPPDEELRRV